MLHSGVRTQVVTKTCTKCRIRTSGRFRVTSLHSTASSHPRNASTQLKQLKASINALSATLRVKMMDDWYTKSFKDVSDNIYGVPPERYNFSLFRLLSVVYPEQQWRAHKFSSADIVGSPENQRDILDDVAMEVGIKIMDDWSRIHSEDVLGLFGSNFSQKYQGSVSKMLKELYPSHPWNNFYKTWGFWDDVSHQRQVFDEVGSIMNIKLLDDMVTIPASLYIQHGGKSTLSKYNGSVITALKELYPHHQFKTVDTKPSGYWKRKRNQTKFLQRLTKSLHLNNPSEWYRVSSRQIRERGGQGMLSYYPYNLKTIYPKYEWRWVEFSHHIKKAKQRILLECVEALFPNTVVQEEQFIGTGDLTGGLVNLDIFVPAFNLAFEYQGEQHYYDIPATALPASVASSRDVEKATLCQENGIHLIVVPYWMDLSYHNIATLVSKQLPGLIKAIHHSEDSMDASLDINRRNRSSVMWANVERPVM